MHGIAIIGYKRKDNLMRCLDSIPDIPAHDLYIFLDAPAKNRDRQACMETQEAAKAWAQGRSRVSIIIASTNLGSVGSIPKAVTHVLQLHESAIIIEDDCLPSVRFLPFCTEMLNRYRSDSRIGMVAGSCLLPDKLRAKCKSSYYYSEFTHTWGWATWRRAWQYYNHNLDKLQDILLAPRFRLFRTSSSNSHWGRLGRHQSEPPHSTSWDFRWLLSSAANSMLCVVPKDNLISNIGFDEQSTHTKNACPLLMRPHHNQDPELVSPQCISPWTQADDWWYNTLISKAPIPRARRLLRRYLHRLM